MNRPPKPEPLTCACGADGRVWWVAADKRWAKSRPRWMRSSKCGFCHYDIYRDQKLGKQRKSTPHALKIQAAMRRKERETQVSPALALFRSKIQGVS